MLDFQHLLSRLFHHSQIFTQFCVEEHTWRYVILSDNEKVVVKVAMPLIKGGTPSCRVRGTKGACLRVECVGRL